MPPFPIERILRWGAVIAAAVLIFTAVANLCFWVSEGTINHTVDVLPAHQIRIGQIFYFFPRTILLKNITISRRDNPAVSPALSIKTMEAKVSLVGMVIKRKFGISSLSIPEVDSPADELKDFLRQNGELLADYIVSMPKIKFRFIVGRWQIRLADQGDSDSKLVLKFDLKAHTKKVSLSGEVTVQRNRINSEAIKVAFLAHEDESSFVVDQLVVKKSTFYANLWARSSRPVVTVGGYGLFSEDNKDSELSEVNKKNHFWKHWLTALGLRKPDLPDISASVYLLDLDGNLRIKWPRITLEKLSLTINNAPVAVNGYVDFIDLISYAFDLKVGREGTVLKQAQADLQARVELRGTWEEDIFHNNGQLTLYFPSAVKGPDHTPDRVEWSFKDFTLATDRFNRIDTRLAEGELTFWANNNPHRVELHNMNAALNWVTGRLQMMEIKGPFYDGALNWRVWFDSSRSPLQITGAGNVIDVESNRLEPLLVHFAKIFGRLDSDMTFNNIPKFKLEGNLHFTNGHLKEFDFFKWLADTFAMPSLYDVPFNDAQARFVVTENEAGIYDIDLASDQVALKGYYAIANHNLVSSELTLDFGRELLESSPKFRSVMNMFEKDRPSLPLIFKMSGPQDAMNFQWMDSEIKQRIRSRIPDFIERRIERGIDTMIDKPVEEK